MDKKKIIIIVAVLVVIAVVVLFAICSNNLFKPAEEKLPSGTWTVKESYEGSLTSDFSTTVQNLDDATHYDLYIETVLIGEKCLLDESVRSLSILFTKPEAMEVKFYSSETAEEPLTTAWCHESGILVFPGTEYPPAGETVEEAEGGENSSAGEAGANHNEQSGSGEPGSAEKPGEEGEEPDNNDETSGSNNQSSSGDTGNANEAPGGNWIVEPYQSGVSDFKVTLQNLAQVTHYELYAAGTIVGERVALDHYVRSIGLMFSDPDLLEVYFFESATAGESLARAKCDGSGELIFLDD